MSLLYFQLEVIYRVISSMRHIEQVRLLQSASEMLKENVDLLNRRYM